MTHSDHAALLLANTHDEMTACLANSAAHSLDDKIREAIDIALGEGCWDMDALMGRVHRFSYPDGRAVYCLDGQDILEVYPFEWETVVEIDKTKYVARQKYRMLADEA